MSETNERAETLFAAALSLAATEQRDFLERECNEDPAMAEKIGALLRAHAEGGFLETSPGGEVETADLLVLKETLADRLIGKRIGRYKLLEKIGEGGCGLVYLAEQEEPIRRRLALKVIKLGLDTDEVVTRFEAERQALALMDHPSIARVFDCGATETGRPFFVMELVHGVRITQYCEDHRLPTAERLQLFVAVCRAIQHAHEKGVIHRDIKPSNILVTVYDGTAVPKIIDFGVAKATEARLTDKTLFTGHAQFIGTPIYMSPEQADMRVAGVDARSDVYSLGVVLYELLTGCTPHDGKELANTGIDEMRRRLQEDEPLRPSARLASMEEGKRDVLAAQRQTAAPKLIGLLRGDLDWIVMRCIAKDAAQRYPTAAAVAADLERYLRNEPVTAKAPSLYVVARKRLGRHRTIVAAVLTAIAFGGGALWLKPGGNPAASALWPAGGAQSIAVLPFANLSPDPANAFFAEGMHEDVIVTLAKIHDFRVISRTSVMAYKVGTRNLRAIASELGVANILEGSVQRDGGKVRVTAQLIDAASERPIWAEIYDRDLTDAFKIESDLAEEIAGALRAKLTADERQLIARRPTSSQEADDLYHRGLTQYQGLGFYSDPKKFDEVIALYTRAIAKDPGFALAYVQRSLVHASLYRYVDLDPRQAQLDLARADADRAVQLAPDLPETKLARGVTLNLATGDWHAALEQFYAAETGLPNDDQLFWWIGDTLNRLGRWDEAIRYFERASEINPRGAGGGFNAVQTMYWLRRFSHVRDTAGKYLVRFPDHPALKVYSALASYELDGKRDALYRAIETMASESSDANRLEEAYVTARLHGDSAVADRELANPALQRVPSTLYMIYNPVALDRALAAFLAGEKEPARVLAERATAYFQQEAWNRRQQPWALIGQAKAEACAGRGEQALKDAQAAWAVVRGRDAMEAIYLRPLLGEVLVLLGRRDDALALLTEMMANPCSRGPRELRLDPIWARLADDPRFDQILGSAQPIL